MKDNWIKVEDELPKEGDDLYIYSKEGGVREGYLNDWFKKSKYKGSKVEILTVVEFADEYSLPVRNITHWQLKPKPPEPPKD